MWLLQQIQYKIQKVIMKAPDTVGSSLNMKCILILATVRVMPTIHTMTWIMYSAVSNWYEMVLVSDEQ